MYLTWLDSNSWLIELGTQRILLDPWLVGSLVFSNSPWLFRGQRRVSRPIPENIDLILLSQGLEDHAHPPTLEQLDRSIPVVASPNAAKVVQKLGYSSVTAIAHGETYTLNHSVQIQAFPGAPIGPFLTENGYLLEELESGLRLYYEPHGYHSPQVQNRAPVDVAIAPVQNLELPLAGPIIQGWDSALQMCQMLQPQVILPTAAGGEVVFDGLIDSVLREKGSAAEFRAVLAQNKLATRLIEPEPGERFELNLFHK